MSLPLHQNFIAIAIPAVIGMIAVLLINHDRSASMQHANAGSGLAQAPANMSVVRGS